VAASLGELDRRDRAWWTDWVARVLVFGGGISAIVFIVGIFVFITQQGLDFTLHLDQLAPDRPSRDLRRPGADRRHADDHGAGDGDRGAAVVRRRHLHR
jgi:hypothetical protein